jgi:hypothetical protein
MNDHADGMLTIPARELRAMQAENDALRRQLSELQLFLVMELREKGRVRYSHSEMEAVKQSQWGIEARRDEESRAVFVTVQEAKRPEPVNVTPQNMGNMDRAAAELARSHPRANGAAHLARVK